VTDKGPEGERCDHCGKNAAVVHLTQVVKNEMTTSHLCEVCAAEKGLQANMPPGNLPLADFLAKLGGNEPPSYGALDEGLVCSFCKLSARDFKEVGRLGCPHCYSTFETHLRGLLRRVHGSTQHVGKVYLPPDPTITEREKRLEGLRRKLERAVETEDFERAAELRDQIRALEPVL
jgi:protein arginine kinase activator